MKKTKIVVLEENIGDWYDTQLQALGCDMIVYSYNDYGYEGSGFMIGRKGRKYFYHEMSHCSCNGPLDNIESTAKALVGFKDIKTIIDKGYSDDAKEVYKYIKSKPRTKKRKANNHD